MAFTGYENFVIHQIRRRARLLRSASERLQQKVERQNRQQQTRQDRLYRLNVRSADLHGF
jgi:hypothetical protein